MSIYVIILIVCIVAAVAMSLLFRKGRIAIRPYTGGFSGGGSRGEGQGRAF